MRIAYVASRYPAVSQAFLTSEVRALRAAGLEVETFSIRAARPSEPRSGADREEAERTQNLLPSGLGEQASAHLEALGRSPFYYLLTLARALRLAGPGARAKVWALFYFGEAMLLRRHCRRLGISHIHAVQFADGAADVALLAAHRSYTEAGEKWSFSVSVHGPGEFYEVSRYGLGEKVRRAHLVAAVSEFTRSQLMALVEEWHAERIHVVHMGVDTERYELTEHSGRSGSGVRVICVARLVRHKGHATLLRALATLRDEGLALEATLVGEGPERAALEELSTELGLSGLVRFAGAVDQDDLPDLYAQADISCLPTLAEAVGVVNMEAMATGLAVVCSDLMGVPELIEHERSGLLVSPGREEELGEALRRLAGDPGLRERLGTEGRRVVEQRFDANLEGERLAGLLSEFAP